MVWSRRAKINGFASQSQKKLPEEGLEPPRREALGSKPSVSANSTTPAKECHLIINKPLERQ